ncbi:MAG: hypothetical protein KAV42_11515 [Candidatus Krumholzibacteria bacterium]|nr:hypothetical protein [Candidatus Krumholzibacteria bacterium]
MKKITSLLLFLSLLLSFALLLTSCEGEQGPVGPAGVDAKFTITTVSFTGEDAGISGSSSYCNIVIPEITQDVIDNGVVLVYLNTSTGVSMANEWILMPFSGAFSGEVAVFGCAYEPGTLMLSFTTTAVEWPFPAAVNYHFKVVTLTGALQGSVNMENFEEVRSYYLNGQRVLE